MAKPTGNTKLPNDDGIAAGGPYMIELLFDAPPKLDASALRAALERRLGRVDHRDPNVPMFALLDHLVTFKDGQMPALVSFMEAQRENVPEDAGERFASALQQTRNWDGAAEVLARCKHSVLLTDFAAGPLPRDERLRIVDGALRAAIETLPVRALGVLPSDRVVDPAAYARGQSITDHLANLFVNIRLFNVGNGAAREHVMDSTGLAIFGLPDVQCHFVGGDPNAFAGFLFGCAAYLFEKGDVIEDGHTVPGQGGERWPCQHEMSLVAPKRVVVDVRPGRFTPPSRK